MKIEKTLPEIDIEKFELFFEERTGEELSLTTLSKFDDKVEITSQGKLMPSVDFNLMEVGQSESKKSYTPESAETMSEKMSEKTRVKTREKTREKILSVLKATPYITMNELAEIVGISKKGVEWQMAKLKKEGRIKRIGPDKGGHWDVIECTE